MGGIEKVVMHLLGRHSSECITDPYAVVGPYSTETVLFPYEDGRAVTLERRDALVGGDVGNRQLGGRIALCCVVLHAGRMPRDVSTRCGLRATRAAARSSAERAARSASASRVAWASADGRVHGDSVGLHANARGLRRYGDRGSGRAPCACTPAFDFDFDLGHEPGGSKARCGSARELPKELAGNPPGGPRRN